MCTISSGILGNDQFFSYYLFTKIKLRYISWVSVPRQKFLIKNFNLKFIFLPLKCCCEISRYSLIQVFVRYITK